MQYALMVDNIACRCLVQGQNSQKQVIDLKNFPKNNAFQKTSHEI